MVLRLHINAPRSLLINIPKFSGARLGDISSPRMRVLPEVQLHRVLRAIDVYRLLTTENVVVATEN